MTELFKEMCSLSGKLNDFIDATKYESKENQGKLRTKKEANMEQQISELTMLLIYLTGWKEDSRRSKDDKKVFRSWLFHRFEILDELQNQGLIRLTSGGKSLTVTEKGKQAAKELKKKFLSKTNEQLIA